MSKVDKLNNDILHLAHKRSIDGRTAIVVFVDEIPEDLLDSAYSRVPSLSTIIQSDQEFDN